MTLSTTTTEPKLEQNNESKLIRLIKTKQCPTQLKLDLIIEPFPQLTLICQNRNKRKQELICHLKNKNRRERKCEKENAYIARDFFGCFLEI